MITNSDQRILLVDDEESLLQLNSEVLTGAGYRVETAKDGFAGWKLCQTDCYDLLITDNKMPRVSGIELIKKLQAAHMTCPVIMASSELPVDIEEFHLAATLEKPFAPDELLQVVKEVLHQQLQNSFTPKLKSLARRLLLYEAATGTRTNATGTAVFRVCEKLREPLSKLLGHGGFHSLLSRALVLAGAQVTWLLTLKIEAGGSLEGVDELEAKQKVRAVAEGEIMLVSQLLGLLVTFIGPVLTLSLLKDIWPKLDQLEL